MKIENQSKIDDYYQALLDKNPDYVGVFFVGVKTTSVFCIATCRARKPKKENIEFFTTFKEALEVGYRPCKICKPTENAYKPPQEVEKAIDLVRKNPKAKITDYQLKTENISPIAVRNWFKKHYGITFHAYQRMYRINNAFEELQNGKNTTKTAFDSGYESLSGFGYTYKKLMGKSPKNNKNQEVILISRLTTPIGAMFVCATQKGICLLEFTNRKMLETEFQDLQKRRNATILTGENEHIIQAKNELQEYFEGKRTSFEVALDPVGTDFQKLVWNELLKIPYGTTTTYLNQAKSLDKVKAIRAVASANGYNKISIIIPCHRVIGSNGELTGYGGGLERKKWLLDFESNLQQTQLDL
ncbi:methylated-DNA--[protein]-cysteine S-methyltransferase [Weeksellaceae bacterium TAE3-ERU29]|nr:methylated-DNA--[protein]-cysteine S-methyltransferase [Weeksellaceae bacterium TAE3-ERU29]